MLLDAAERLQAAALAGFGIVARVNIGAAGEEVVGELRNVRRAMRSCRRRVSGFFTKPTVAGEIGQQRRSGICDAADEFEVALSGAEFGEDEAAERLDPASSAKPAYSGSCTSSGRGRSQVVGV